MMKQFNHNAVYRVNSAGHLAMVEKYDPSTMVIKTLTPEMRLTPKQVAMLEEAEQYPIVYEDDCPEMTTEMAAAFKRAAEMRDKRKAVAFWLKKWEAAKTMRLIMSNPTEREMIRMRQDAQSDWTMGENQSQRRRKSNSGPTHLKKGR